MVRFLLLRPLDATTGHVNFYLLLALKKVGSIKGVKVNLLCPVNQLFFINDVKKFGRRDRKV